MDRQEPTISKPDMADLEFRPTSYRGPTRPQVTNDGIVWKLSLGIGVAVLAALLLFNAYERHQDRKDAEAALRDFEKELERQRIEDERFLKENPPVRVIRVGTPSTERQRAPLRPGERCIQGERFKRIQNGWQQLPYDPC
ncbi:hypothetical protein [Pseudoxanthomonas beigongshangi]